MKTTPARRRFKGFTLIELITVIGIIGLLSGLIVGLMSLASKQKLKRVQAELAQLTSEIADYQSKNGFYPPDNPLEPAINPLFYELRGTIDLGPRDLEGHHAFQTTDGRDIMTPTKIAVFNLSGFLNSTTNPREVRNFHRASQTGDYSEYGSTPSTTVKLLTVPLEGTNSYSLEPGVIVNPWRYVLSNPNKHNLESYDLWVDVRIGKTFYRVCNWSKDPIPIEP